MSASKSPAAAPVGQASGKGGDGAFKIVKLIFGAAGIYGAFMYYGLLQEDITHYKDKDGNKFTAPWLLQALEAFANVVIGAFGILLFQRGKTEISLLPQTLFSIAGFTQVCAKALTNSALFAGVSFPIVTLSKSGKMVPVMIGSILLGKASYTFRQYMSVFAIVAGTAIVSMGDKKKASADSSTLGLVYIALSLACDGITGGLQNKIKGIRKNVASYDFMTLTNFYMCLVAVVAAVSLQEFVPGSEYITNNPLILPKILKFSLCSAIGQSFIFFTISEFDSLTCTTVTTTRKVFSVLASIYINKHPVSNQGWAGIALASAGIFSELTDNKKSHGSHGDEKKQK